MVIDLQKAYKLALSDDERKDLSFNEWLEIRNRGKTDLYFLARDICKKDLFEHVHRQVTDFFVKKNSSSLPEHYTQQELHTCIGAQDWIRERLLLYPRGTYKSTIDVIDCLQWIINFPDIRIIILTGTLNLATKFVFELKAYFTLSVDGSRSYFQKFYPEFCVQAGTGLQNEFWVPDGVRRLGLPDPTVRSAAIETNTTGLHCDILKCDDVITNENSGSEDRREKLLNQFDTLSNVPDPHGFIDVIGTRYAVDDLYGSMLKRDIEYKTLKYLCSASWTVKPEAADKHILELTAEDVILLFPERQPFHFLRKKLVKNETVFRCQQLNEPAAGSNITFDMDALHAHQCQLSAVPEQGTIFVSWDWAMSGASSGDMSCGAVGKITEDGKLFILELVFGRFKPSELAFQIVNLTKKYAPKVTVIEKSNGAELLQLEIQRQAMLYNVALNIHWAVVSNEKDAKRNRIKGLEVLLNSDRLWFAPGPWIDKAFDQFHRYTGERKNKGRHDDIPDAIAYLQLFVPSNVAMTDDEKKAVDEEAEKREAEARARAYHAMMFATRGDNEPADELLPPIPDRTPRSALNDIFGGNGMHV